MNPLALKISFVLLAGEAAACLFFSRASIPADLHEAFRQAEEGTPMVEAELHSIEAWKSEHKHPYEALSALLYAKDNTISFRHLQIGDFGEGAWVRAEIAGSNAEAIDAYLSRLEGDGFIEAQIKDRRTEDSMEIAGVEIRRQMP